MNHEGESESHLMRNIQVGTNNLLLLCSDKSQMGMIRMGSQERIFQIKANLNIITKSIISSHSYKLTSTGDIVLKISVAILMLK